MNNNFKRQRRHCWIKSFVLLCDFFWPMIALGAPSISIVSGDFSQGGTVVVTGSGFGAKNPAAPYIWANFDDGSGQPSSLGQIRSWTVANFTPTAGVGVRNTVGMQSYLWNYQEQNFGALLGNIPSGFGWTDYNSHLYLFRKGKRNWVLPSNMNWKNLRFWYSGGSFTQNIAFGGVIDEGGGFSGYMCAFQTPMSAVCQDNITQEQTHGYDDGRWNTEQFIFKAQSGAGQLDGFYQYIMNGRTAIEVPYTDYMQRFFTVTPGTPGEAWYVHDESANEPDPPSGARTWSDDVYVDRTWSRVMLSNRSTWGTSPAGPLYEIQIPTGWSDTSITVQFNQGEFQNGATVYLYVVDANNDANPNGYPITIAGGGTTPPAAPRGLRVN